MTYRIGIVGGSLAGLAAANALHRLGHTVRVFEKAPAALESRGSSLGYVNNALWEHVRGAPMMRLGRRAHRSQGAYYYGDLWRFLYDGLPRDVVRFDAAIADLGDAPHARPTLDGERFDAVILADGGFSSLRRFVAGVEQAPEYAGQVVFRTKLARGHFPDFAGEGGYMEGRTFAMMLEVVRNDGSAWIMGGVGVGVPEHEVTRPSAGVNRQDMSAATALPTWFLPYVRRVFRPHPKLVRWLDLAAEHGKITPQPLYEFGADRVTQGRLMMIGDAAHMASPRTAAGAHTGLLDAAGILDAFSTHPTDLDAAIAAYGPGGRERAQALYARSREVSRPLAYRADDDLRQV